jgi:hypothetical protein
MKIDNLNWAHVDDTETRVQGRSFESSYLRPMLRKMHPELETDFLTENRIQTLINWAFKEIYGLEKTPKIKFMGKRKRATGSSLVMELPDWARNHLTILHECAHGIAQQIVKNENYEPHGKEFYSILVNLNVKYFGLNEKEVSKKAKEHGIKIRRNWFK